MSVEISKSPELTQLMLGAVEIQIDCVESSDEQLRAWSDKVAKHQAEIVDQLDLEQLRQNVRLMLRHGCFKASGRSKPAQEYLLRCATEKSVLPTINAPVDILNTVSLDYGLPISLLSIGKCSHRLHVRRGLAGESFVFNLSGQELNLEDLIVVCDASVNPTRPVGSPIKDSMAGKIEAGDTHLIAIVYAPARCGELVEKVCNSLTENYQRFMAGAQVRKAVVN